MATPRKPKRSADPHDIADRLHSVAIHLLRRLRRIDTATGVSGPALSALSVVVHAGPITLGDLAAAEQVRPPSMTRTIAELEAAGLVSRRADRDDKRVARVRATARGRRLLAKGRDNRVAELAARLDSLSADQLGQLHGAIETLESVVRD